MIISCKKQKKGSNECGQACVAMLAHADLDEVTARMNKSGTTTAADLRKGLGKYNIKYSLKTTKYKGDLADLCLVLLTNNRDKKLKHWVVYQKGVFYDPAIGRPMKIDRFDNRLKKWDSKITSYIEVYE